ncbi:oligosaccharide flippase family protein [bacterium]|nr:oligosaccharide flippase family protein [bacterium]MBU1984085.1 oligosaccharide flippase family protein [bacterium]
MDSTLSKKTVGNATILTLGAAAEMVLQVFFLLIAGRELGPEEFGFYGYVLSLVMIASAIAHFGLPVMAVREITQRPFEEKEIFAATFRIRSILAVAFFVGAVLIGGFTSRDVAHRWTMWLMFAYLLCLPFDLAFLFDARKMSRWDVPGRIVGRLVSVAVLVLLWWQRGRLSVVDVALCSSLLMVVNVVIAWGIAFRLDFGLRPLAVTREAWKLTRLSVPIVWSNVLTLAYSQGQTVLVKWLSTALQTGFYALAIRLFTPILIFKGVLYRVLLPLVSEVGRDREALTTRLEHIFPALSLIFMPAVGLGIPAAQVLIVPLFGVEYAGAVLPFQIILGHMLLTGMGSTFGGALLASGDARTPTVGLTVGCVFSLLVSALLIPRFGAVGAAVAACVGEVVSVVYAIPKFLRISRPRVAGRLSRIAASSIAGCIAFFGITAVSWMPEAAALGLSSLVILAGLGLSGEIRRDRVRTMIALFKKDSGGSVR